MRKSKEEGEKMRERVELLSNSVQQQKDEICQLSTLYKTERDATLALQKALSSEKENFNRFGYKKGKYRSQFSNFIINAKLGQQSFYPTHENEFKKTFAIMRPTTQVFLVEVPLLWRGQDYSNLKLKGSQV